MKRARLYLGILGAVLLAQAYIPLPIVATLGLVLTVAGLIFLEYFDFWLMKRFTDKEFEILKHEMSMLHERLTAVENTANLRQAVRR